MNLTPSSYLDSLGGYAFAEVDKAKEKIIAERGSDYLIDFGVGDPTDPTPAVAREEAAVHALRNPDEGYPSYEGEEFFRHAVAGWFKRRFDVELDPESEITATLGSKQSVFSLPMAFVDPGDVVLIPDPGYPPYTTGAKQRGGQPVYMPLKPENNFLPDLDAIDPKTADKASLLWLNSPNNPTTAVIPPDFYRQAIAFCRQHNILLCSDEAYSEMYYEAGPTPTSLFEIDGGRDVGLVIHSLSKRSNMTNYRVGFVAGKNELLQHFKEVQTNMHSGQAQILQAAAAAALTDEQHVQEMRQTYGQRREILLPYLQQAGFRDVYASAGFYVWARTPESTGSADLCKLLLEEAGVNTTPGAALAQQPENGSDFVRFALIQNQNRTEEAGKRLANLDLSEVS